MKQWERTANKGATTLKRKDAQHKDPQHNILIGDTQKNDPKHVSMSDNQYTQDSVSSATMLCLSYHLLSC